MYREILFRGKRIDNGEWTEGCLLIDYETGQHFIHAKGNSLHESNKANKRGSLNFSAYEIEPQTASQYTGMEDRNGRRIFENDLIYSDFNKVEFLGGSWSVNETDINPPAELGRLADASGDKQSTRIKPPLYNRCRSGKPHKIQRRYIHGQSKFST